MKFKKPGDKSKSKNNAKANSEKITSFYLEITKGEAKTLPDLDLEEIKKSRVTNYNRNLLHVAVWYKQNEIVSQICENEELKCLLNEQDNNGDTPLHLAVFSQNLEAYRLLLVAGGDATIPNNQNELPLEVIQDTKEWEEFSQRMMMMPPHLMPDIKLTLIPDHLVPHSPAHSSGKDSSRSNIRLSDITIFSPAGSDSLVKPVDQKMQRFSLNEPKHKFINNHETTATNVFSHSISIGEDLVDSDLENHAKDMLNVVRSKAFKNPKTLSQVIESSIKDHSMLYMKSSSQPQNKKYGSSLCTKISSDTFYHFNKLSPKPIPEPDDWPKNEDLGF